MKSLTTAVVALAVSLCAPVAVYANDSAAKVNHFHVDQRDAAIPSNATALLPSLAHDPDTDGLSRSRDDCNKGCIDN